MTKPLSRGRSGPALTIGLPLLLLTLGGYFGFKHFRAKQSVATNLSAPKSAASGSSPTPETSKVRIAGDLRSDYSAFRGERQLTAALASEGLTLEYSTKEAFSDAAERLKALAAGDLDATLVTLDAFLQAGAQLAKNGDYPGVIVLAVDESAGADALFLPKGRVDLDDVRAEDTVCCAGTNSGEHLWDFASLSFEALSEALPKNPGKSVKDCWDKLNAGSVQIAVLGQPYTTLAERAGFPKTFSTGGQADDLILNVLVVNRAFRSRNPETLRRFTYAYFAAVAAYSRDTDAHATFLAEDCGSQCQADATIGASILGTLDFLDLEENLCLWFGQCATPSKLKARIEKTGKLLAAKGKLAASALPNPEAVVDASFLVAAKNRRLQAAALAAEVSGPSTTLPQPKFEAKEPGYQYVIAKAAAAAAVPPKVGTLTLPGIAFAHASYQLDAAAQSTIVAIADSLRSFPLMCIRIIGYSTKQEDPDPAHRLSKLRGFAIAQELTRLDPATFPTNRFDVRGLGAGRTQEGKSLANGAKARKTEFGLFTCATK